MCSIRIGGQEAEFLCLTFHRRSHPGSAAYWDVNWLDVTAEVAAGVFRGSLDGALRTDEFERFRGQLAQVYETLTGEAVFETMERWLNVRMVGDGRGHIEAHCRLCDDLAFGNTLDFQL